MALVNDQHQKPSRPLYESILDVESSIEFPQISPYGFDDYNQQEDGDGLESPNNNKVVNNNNNQVNTNSPTISSTSSANSSNNGFTIHHNNASNYQPHEEAHTLINFKSIYNGSFIHNNSSNSGSLLSYLQDDQVVAPENYQKQSHNHMEEVSHLRSSSSDYQDSTNEWVYSDVNVVDLSQESATQQSCFNKRPYVGEENMQSPKKRCTTSASKKPTKPKSSSNSKDPQSVVAKNRRERISEKLKILQDLVPNGSKVDLVTMLEKAIGYVKFLQLQMKVLATDEFWPAAGGKAPDISQVREAIDAILSSQRPSGAT